MPFLDDARSCAEVLDEHGFMDICYFQFGRLVYEIWQRVMELLYLVCSVYKSLPRKDIWPLVFGVWLIREDRDLPENLNEMDCSSYLIFSSKSQEINRYL